MTHTHTHTQYTQQSSEHATYIYSHLQEQYYSYVLIHVKQLCFLTNSNNKRAALVSRQPETQGDQVVQSIQNTTHTHTHTHKHTQTHNTHNTQHTPHTTNPTTHTHTHTTHKHTHTTTHNTPTHTAHRHTHTTHTLTLLYYSREWGIRLLITKQKKLDKKK